MYSRNSSKFDISVTVSEENQGFVMDWEYSIDLFRERTINQLATHFLEILGDISRNAHIRISEIPLSVEDKKEFSLAIENDSFDFN